MIRAVIPSVFPRYRNESFCQTPVVDARQESSERESDRPSYFNRPSHTVAINRRRRSK